MADMPMSGEGSKLAPGMTQVVVAGTIYAITDDKGQEVEIIPRNDPLVIAFLHAYDDFLSILRAMPSDSQPAMRAKSIVDSTWREMPTYLVKDFPSMKRLYVPGGRRGQ